MDTKRRDFLKGAAWMGAAAMAAGCMSERMHMGAVGAAMSGFYVAPMKKIRIGFVGIGSRGKSAVNRVALIPGCEAVALCDLKQECVDEAQKALAAKKLPKAKEYVGEDAYKRLCEDPNVDLVYNTTPIDWHRPISCYAMKAGKHTLMEVCACSTTDECWEIVETCEQTRRHCMMLENCCYGEYELLQLNLARQGILGEIVHSEAAYIHDCRSLEFRHVDDPNDWRLLRRLERMGNQYPTHGLGPVALAMNINHGDRFDYLTSMEGRSAALREYTLAKYPADSWQNKLQYMAGDMNLTNIRTANGNTITLQYNTVSPRPYSRINMLTGTKGIAFSYPKFHVAFEKKAGDGAAHGYFSDEKAEKIRQEYKHPLWKVVGDVAAKVGGHGGMDFIMDLRWAFCLQNGLPLDMDVYDLAAWSSIYQLSEKSAKNRSKSVDIPDFTRGGWKLAKPVEIGGVDLNKMGLSPAQVEKDKAQLNV